MIRVELSSSKKLGTAALANLVKEKPSDPLRLRYMVTANRCQAEGSTRLCAGPAVGERDGLLGLSLSSNEQRLGVIMHVGNTRLHSIRDQAGGRITLPREGK